jgi:hypothetical protein
MARSLITFPLRLGLRGASIAVDGAASVAVHALGLVGRLADILTKDGGPDVDIDGSHPEARETRPEPRRPAADTPRTPRPVTERRAAEVEPAEAEPTVSAEEAPAHVSEEPTLVAEVAEAGAEDGAGAEVHVDEPWENYNLLGANDVIDQITGASTAVLAAVELYEQSHRRRKTVLEAVERQLRRPSQ